VSVPPRPDLDQPSRRWIVLAVATVVMIALAGTKLVVDRNRATSTDVCDTTRALLDGAESTPLGDVHPIEDLDPLLPESVGAGFTRQADRPIPDAQELASGRGDPSFWLDVATETRFLHGYEHWWDLDPGPIAEAQVLQFATHEDALSFQDRVVFGSCHSSREAFDVAGIEGTIGLQIWWSNGDVSEQVSFVRGSRRYLVSIRAGAAPPPRAMVLVATRSAAELAR
jgi:hypothetical protein